MKNQKNRSMRVHAQSGYNYKATPTIILKGQWLQEMGFEIGDYISISCEDGKLIITPDAEKAEIAKAEAEFMEKEMKKLQKKFQKEKEMLHIVFYREKVGIEETKEILTSYLRRKDRNINRLVRYAEMMKCGDTMKKYLEVLV